ncbi:unnamed protein product [Paramecium primaurelia]|uniref:Trafficking protein particle complex subunit n=2 Tax=Paramecium TaxID=5884 RepID=A0A8S1V3I3_9CILI|nr:unnamed protein product [Paramecium primaurelia]CAD8171394.1 unnamed protein product [Paramecium pentaurelia]
MLNTKYLDQDNLFELIIFQGYKNLVFYWNFAKGIVNTKAEIQDLLKQNRIQNIYGVSEGLKGFSQAFSSEPITNFRYFLTNYFKFTIYEMCSGVKIILLSNISDQTDYSETLKEVYTNYLEIIKRNPFYVHGEPLDNPLFIEKITDIFEPFQKKK